MRGVLEVIRPLDRDQERIHHGLRSTILLVAGSGASLLGLSAFLIYLGNRRNRVSRSFHTDAHAAPTSARTGAGGVKPEKTGEDRPDTPQFDEATAASVVPEPVPEEIVVVWRAAHPIGTLTPVRLVVPTDGILRLALSASESAVEMRVEMTGGIATADSGIAPCVEVNVQSGSVVVVRIRPTSGMDARYLLTTELLVRNAGNTGRTISGSNS